MDVPSINHCLSKPLFFTHFLTESTSLIQLNLSCWYHLFSFQPTHRRIWRSSQQIPAVIVFLLIILYSQPHAYPILYTFIIEMSILNKIMNVYRIGYACGWQGSHHCRSNIVRAWVYQCSTFTKEAGFVIWGCPGNPNVSNPTKQAWLSITAQRNTSPLLRRLCIQKQNVTVVTF